MKLTHKLLICIIACTLLFSPKTQAQTAPEQGSVIFSLGYGFPNLAKVGLSVLYIDTYDYNDNPVVATGGIGPLSLKGEYFLADKLGLGLSVNMVTTKVVFNYSPTQIFTEKLTKLNALLRCNFHFVTNDHIDFYGGVGIGYNGIFRNRTTAPMANDINFINDPTFIPIAPSHVPVTAELSIGLRYFFTDNIGIYTELGVARAIWQAGLCIKI